MSLLFAAIGATVTALVEVTLVPKIMVGGAGPHPVLVGGVIWTIAAGIDRGITWAFVGGIVLDALLGRPLGASSFALLIAVGGAALIARPFARLRPFTPIFAVPILSLVYSVVLLTLTTALGPAVLVGNPLQLFVPSAIYDAILAIAIGPLVITLHDRRQPAERMEW